MNSVNSIFIELPILIWFDELFEAEFEMNEKCLMDIVFVSTSIPGSNKFSYSAAVIDTLRYFKLYVNKVNAKKLKPGNVGKSHSLLVLNLLFLTEQWRFCMELFSFSFGSTHISMNQLACSHSGNYSNQKRRSRQQDSP